MKKLIAIIIIVFIIILVKNFTATKYSHSEIVALINKGIQNMDNISYEVIKDKGNQTVKHYFKESSWKMVGKNGNFISIALEGKKTYLIDKEKKIMFIYPDKVPFVKKRGLQDDALLIEDFNSSPLHKDQYRYEFAYIRDEKIDNKDCILVKERIYYIETKKYMDNIDNSEGKVRVFWIEKSTGFVIGAAYMDAGKDTATPQSIIKNIKCGEVTDDIFNYMYEISDDYNVFENAGNDVIKIK